MARFAVDKVENVGEAVKKEKEAGGRKGNCCTLRRVVQVQAEKRHAQEKTMKKRVKNAGRMIVTQK